MTRDATSTASQSGCGSCLPDSPLALALVGGLLYYFAASLEVALRTPESARILLSPQNAMLAALMLLTRPGQWWPVALAALPAHFAAHWNFGDPWWQLAWDLAHAALLAMVIGWTLRALIDRRNPFGSLTDFLLYAAVAVVVAPALLAGLAPTIALVLAAGAFEQAMAHWRAGFLSSALAMLTLTPYVYVALLTGPGWLQHRMPLRYIEVLVVATALFAAYHLTFLGGTEPHAALYLLSMPFLWQAVRFGVGGAATALACIATLAVASEHVQKSMALGEASQVIVDLQIGLIIIACTTLLVAVLAEERRRQTRAAHDSQTRHCTMLDRQIQLAVALTRAELRLRNSDERLSHILRTTRDVIYDWNVVSGEAWCNGNIEAEGTAVITQPCSRESWQSFIHIADRQRVILERDRALDGTAASWEAEYRYARRGGPMRWVHNRACILRDANGNAARMIGAVTDLTDRKDLEEANRALARFARLAMVGKIAASIAHEINQPLSAILYNTEAGLLTLNSERYDKNEIRDILDDIGRDNRRASELVRRLRELVQEHELRRDPLNLNQVVVDVVGLVRIEARRRHTELITQCEKLPPVLGDQGRLQQVLLNLILNSMDALGTLPNSRRRIQIRTTCSSITRIQVEVVDSGCGIDAESLPKIFDSFFTSKADGMGLGLAIARSIVEAHGGRIWAHNNDNGVGATLAFEIDCLDPETMLPALSAPARLGARLN